MDYGDIPIWLMTFHATAMYRIFSLLSTCAYIPTCRKKTCLIARCAQQQENRYVQMCMHMLHSIKGHGQVLDRAIVQVIKAHIDCSKSTKFERSIMLSTIPKMLDSKLAYDCSYICTNSLCKSKVRIYAYTQNEPHSEYLGQQNCICLIANVRL